MLHRGMSSEQDVRQGSGELGKRGGGHPEGSHVLVSQRGLRAVVSPTWGAKLQGMEIRNLCTGLRFAASSTWEEVLLVRNRLPCFENLEEAFLILHHLQSRVRAQFD